ncbi:hypothetical protein GCM10010251_74260 [Streptomyces aurantiogriseus]|uniref:Uncharacterized protein n=1 Tax=Streptomyces aurantiogriseus TaxID=66870 RepID=A0A918FKE6_9ACTN|nr:hypothetical protein GCM10010251_74260 [Streptomyces aurantiogriseus]
MRGGDLPDHTPGVFDAGVGAVGACALAHVPVIEGKHRGMIHAPTPASRRACLNGITGSHAVRPHGRETRARPDPVAGRAVDTGLLRSVRPWRRAAVPGSVRGGQDDLVGPGEVGRDRADHLGGEAGSSSLRIHRISGGLIAAGMAALLQSSVHNGARAVARRPAESRRQIQARGRRPGPRTR